MIHNTKTLFPTTLSALLLLLCAMSCQRNYHDPEPEDYATLFPFKGIEKPKISYEDQVRQVCDPYEALESYSYPGVEISEGKRKYTVTLTCQVTERGAVPDEVYSRFVVKYIGEDKQIHIIGSSASVSGAEEIMTLEEPYEVTIEAESGYPMYLSVNGTAPRESNITASIRAVSEDGLTVVKELKVSQTQNREGQDYISQPFCEFIILP